MNPGQLQEKLKQLMELDTETEWVEFKEAKTNFDFDDVGRYFSALSNEANLNAQPSAWLIFGVTNKAPREVVGSSYRQQPPGLDRLKQEIAQHTNHRLTFTGIHELTIGRRRTLLFQIPPAPRGVPTTWKGHAYGRVHEALGPLGLHEIEQIRGQAPREDWSKQVCAGAILADLDPQAVSFAREQYMKKNPALAVEVNQWSDETFFNKCKVCIAGQITRTAIILLGRGESEHFLSSAVARITWLLKDEQGVEKDYQHFGPPLLLAVNQVFTRIRNLTYRYLPDASLFPTEVSQYDPWVIREMLHNAIAHMDYAQAGRVNVVEEPDSLLVTNLGEFLPGSVEEVIRRDAPPEFYRNRFLAEAMVNLNMIDTIGSGIKRMFTKQRQRSFPMPDYDLSEPGRVKVRIIGKIIDEKYTRMLLQRSDLTLTEVIALDKVQKRRPLTEEESMPLKVKQLVEGRRPNLYVSARVAAATETKADYIRRRAFNKSHYKEMLRDYLECFGQIPRQEVERLLMDKLSDALTLEQKNNFIRNLLQEMRREGSIRPVGRKRGRGAKWELSKLTLKGLT